MSKYPKSKSKDQWRKELTPEQFAVCWLKKTEVPFSGKLNDFWESGAFHCVCCDQELFKSESKFSSHSGWPSFLMPVNSEAVIYEADTSHGMQRIEVLCSGCGAHLGHVFEDGPEPTGKRYCINSVALTFVDAD